MAKSKLKKQIKKLTNRISECEDYAIELEILIKSVKLQFDELNTKVNSLQSQVNNSIQLQIEALLKYTQDQNNKIQAQIDEFKAQKCECHTNTQKTDKISTAGQDDGNLGQSEPTWFDESGELSQEVLESLRKSGRVMGEFESEIRKALSSETFVSHVGDGNETAKH